MFSKELKWKISSWSNYHKQGREPNIFLFSTARSGSTWLMEVIASHSGIKVVNEPFLVTRNSDSKSPFPPSWDFLLPNSDREAMLEEYVAGLILNKLGVGSPLPHEKLYRLFSNRMLFKVLRCKDMMNWFEERFDIQIIYLVRHPVATSVSRSNYGRLPLFLSNDIFCDRYLTPGLRNYGFNIIEHGSELEKKALDWCLQNTPPLRFLDRSKWICTTYEDLVTQPNELPRVLKQLKLSASTKLNSKRVEPSLSSRRSDDTTQQYLMNSKYKNDRSYLIRKWRKKVTEKEERQVFTVLEHFNIDLYQFGHDMPVNRV